MFSEVSPSGPSGAVPWVTWAVPPQFCQHHEQGIFGTYQEQLAGGRESRIAGLRAGFCGRNFSVDQFQLRIAINRCEDSTDNPFIDLYRFVHHHRLLSDATVRTWHGVFKLSVVLKRCAAGID